MFCAAATEHHVIDLERGLERAYGCECMPRPALFSHPSAGDLAGGQARQAREIQESIKVYETLHLKEFGATEPIDLSAVVELESERTVGTYFIGPRSGGLEVEYEGAEIIVITPQSPLGQQLMGKNTGQRWTANFNGARTSYRIVSVT